MVIGIEHLPEGRTENALGIKDGQAKGISVNNLVRIIIYANFAADTANNNEAREQAFLDHIEVLCKTTEGYVHILMGLGKDIYGNTIMTVKLEPIDCLIREGLIFTGVKFNASLIYNQFSVFNQVLTDILTGIHTVATGDGDVGIHVHTAFPMGAVQNPICEATGEAAAKTDDDTLLLGLFGKVGGKGCFTGAGDTKIDVEHQGMLGITDIMKHGIQNIKNQNINQCHIIINSF